MASYIYPAVFHPNEGGSYTITYPDLPGCITEGKDLANALHMAQDALDAWISYAMKTGVDMAPPSASPTISLAEGEFTSLVRVDLMDERAVRRTVSIPKWMDDQVQEIGLSLSRVLQDALKTRLNAR